MSRRRAVAAAAAEAEAEAVVAAAAEAAAAVTCGRQTEQPRLLIRLSPAQRTRGARGAGHRLHLRRRKNLCISDRPRSDPIPSLRGSLHHSHGKSLPLPRDACQASREGRCSCSCRSRPTATHPPYTPLGCGWQTHHLRARPVASVAIGRASSEGTRPNTRLRMQRRASASREHTPLPVRLLVECHHTW